MSKYHLACLLLFTVITFQPVFTQSNYGDVNPQKYSHGYIVDLNGDTIHGYVNYDNYRYLKFINTEGKKRKYTASKLRGFGDLESDRHMESFFIAHRDNTYFLQRLMSGKASLYLNYEYVDRVYLEVSNPLTAGSTMALNFLNILHARSHFSPVYLVQEDQLYAIPVAKRAFISTMSERLADDPELVTKIFNGEYEFDHICELVYAYNTDWELNE